MLYHQMKMQCLCAGAACDSFANDALEMLESSEHPRRAAPTGRIATPALTASSTASAVFGETRFGPYPGRGSTGRTCRSGGSRGQRPWCELQRFRRMMDRLDDPGRRIVAPMSEPSCYAAAWHGDGLPSDSTTSTSPICARCREVPSTEDDFDFDDCIDQVIEHVQFLGREDARHRGVRQPAVPVLAAVALMNAGRDPPPRAA